jgi:hypothetical protein
MIQSKMMQKLFKIIVVMGLIISFTMAGFGVMPQEVNAAAEHITLTWTADARTTQTITWKTEFSMVGGKVQYAEANKTQVFPNVFKTVDAEVNGLATNAGNLSIHSATLVGLKPGTHYLYRVSDGEAWSDVNRFTTASATAHKFKFLLFGDSQSMKYDVWSTTVHQAYRSNPDAVFMSNVGDLVDVGLDYSQWQGWFDAGKGVIDHIPVAPVVGNHETYTGKKSFSMPLLFTGQFRLPDNGPENLKGQVYPFDYGNAHFSVLDSQAGEERKFVPNMINEQQLWLEKDLQKTDKQWKIVLIHRPPYDNRSADGNGYIRSSFAPIFDKYRVDVVFAGHDHAYTRSYPLRAGAVVESSVGTRYVTTGRSGTKSYPTTVAKEWNEFFYNPQDAPNYLTVEVVGPRLTVKSFKQNGELIDDWSLTK